MQLGRDADLEGTAEVSRCDRHRERVTVLLQNPNPLAGDAADTPQRLLGGLREPAKSWHLDTGSDVLAILI